MNIVVFWKSFPQVLISSKSDNRAGSYERFNIKLEKKKKKPRVDPSRPSERDPAQGRPPEPQGRPSDFFYFPMNFCRDFWQNSGRNPLWLGLSFLINRAWIWTIPGSILIDFGRATRWLVSHQEQEPLEIDSNKELGQGFSKNGINRKGSPCLRKSSNCWSCGRSLGVEKAAGGGRKGTPSSSPTCSTVLHRFVEDSSSFFTVLHRVWAFFILAWGIRQNSRF